jgi:hypothetical protein
MKKSLAVVLTFLAGISAASAEDSLLVFQGACDGSGAAAVDNRHFLSASDEDNVLRLYDAKKPGAPIDTFELEKTLSMLPREEMDIEGATRIGDTFFFISSYKRTKKGKVTAGYLMAVKATSNKDGAVSLSKVGRCDNIGDELAALNPEFDRSLNVEGLTVWKDSQLLIGLRKPSLNGKAVLVPLTNPLRVLQEKEKPAFGKPIEIDLGGMVVRAVEYWPDRSLYLIIAGSEKAHGEFYLYTWSGDTKDGAKQGPVLDVDAESIVVFPGEKKRVLLLSDDSGEHTEDGTGKCRKLPPGSLERTYRARWLSF